MQREKPGKKILKAPKSPRGGIGGEQVWDILEKMDGPMEVTPWPPRKRAQVGGAELSLGGRGPLGGRTVDM